MILLGNLKVMEMEKRLGIKLPDDVAKELEDMRQDRTENLLQGKIHIYDIPFIIACSDMETLIKVRDILMPYSKQMKQAIRIGIDREEKV